MARPRSKLALRGSDVTAVVVLSFLLLVLLGPLLVDQGAVGTAIIQLVAFAGPPLLIAWKRPDGFASLGLQSVSPTIFAATAIIASGLWLCILEWIAPLGMQWGNPAANEELVALFALESRPLWQTLLAFALVPAISEELLHRGAILPMLTKRLGVPAGLLLSSVLFGLFHLNLSRLLPTAVLGLALGALRLRAGSLWPSMLLHFLYNAILLVVSQQDYPLPALLIFPAAALSIGGTAWLVRQTQNEPACADSKS